MSHRDFFFSLWGSDASGNFVDGMKNVCAVIAILEYVGYPNGDILQDDEPTLVFECLSVYSAGPHCPLTVFAPISVLVLFTHSFIACAEMSY